MRYRARSSVDRVPGFIAPIAQWIEHWSSEPVMGVRFSLGAPHQSRFMYYLYVLKSLRDQKSYVGSTNDLKRRLAEHIKGLVPSTKPRRPLKLVYYEAYANETDARHREKALKLKSRAYAQLRKRISESLKT